MAISNPNTNPNANVYPAPNSTTYDGASWYTITGAGDDLFGAATTTYHGYGTTGTYPAQPIKGKQTIKCTKCGKTIAEYWYEKKERWTDASEAEDKTLCRDCHLLEKLKE